MFMKKYLPIKIHHIYFSYGWWFGSKAFFPNSFTIVPISYICNDTIYTSNGNIIGNGEINSWSISRQNENKIKN